MRCSNCGAENPEGLKFCNRAAVRGSSSLAVLTIWLLTPSQSIRLKKSRRSPILRVGSNKTVMNKEGNSCGSLLHHTYWTKSSYGEVPAREWAVTVPSSRLISIFSAAVLGGPTGLLSPRIQVERNDSRWRRGISKYALCGSVIIHSGIVAALVCRLDV